jgi:hypothetical protein
VSGAGDEIAAWNDPSGVNANDSRLPELRSEFRLHRHLLEQPSPPAARNSARQRCDFVGEPAPALLAVPHSIHDRLDGRESLRLVAGCCVRRSLLLAAIAYFILTKALINLHGRGSTLAMSIGRDRKGKISIALYAAAIPLAFAPPWVAGACYVIVAIMWLIQDPRMERRLAQWAGAAQYRGCPSMQLVFSSRYPITTSWLPLYRHHRVRVRLDARTSKHPLLRSPEWTLIASSAREARWGLGRLRR